MTVGERRNLRNGLLFVSPYIVGFLAFSLYPLVASVYYSFCQFNAIQPPVWIGFENFDNLFFHDPVFWKSVQNTLYYTVVSVPLGLAISIGLAMLLDFPLRGMAIYRTIFFLPTIVPVVASAFLWLWVFNPESGLLNGLLRQIFGVSGPGWMADELWAKPSLILMSFWSIGGAIVIFLAGLADVPAVLHEVASLDGAGPWRRFRHVTLPMLTPTILFNLVMGLITSFQFFTQAFVMTAGTGGPADSTLFYALYLYKNAFQYFRMGYASAMAWMLFVVILSATLAVFMTSKRWVYYHGE